MKIPPQRRLFFEHLKPGKDPIATKYLRKDVLEGFDLNLFFARIVMCAWCGGIVD
jgi:hypothetical protein